VKSVLYTLKKGKEAIEKYGWIQGNMGRPNLGYCAMGAINDQRVSHVDYKSAIHALWVELPPGNYDESELSPHPIAQWNDAEGRTKEEVLALYDKAIATEEAKA
jgi:hypothetical protein